MIIFLSVLGELGTVVGSFVIQFNGVLDSFLEIPKNGYKIDKAILDDYQKRQDEAEKEKKSASNFALGTLLLLIPGVNLVFSGIKVAKMKKAVMNDPKIKEALVPMTEKEKEQYSQLDGKLQKLLFSAYTLSKENEEEEFFGFIGNRPIVVDHGLTSLHYDFLLPLAYSFDEVKKLNEVTNYSYRVGKVDGRNIAIIGIPNPDSHVSRVQFKAENYKMTHTYENMTEEEAKDKTFIVYPFIQNDEILEKFEKCIEEISKSREDKKNKTKSEITTPLPEIKQDSLFETEVSNEQQGPVLKKTFNAGGNSFKR